MIWWDWRTFVSQLIIDLQRNSIAFLRRTNKSTNNILVQSIHFSSPFSLLKRFPKISPMIKWIDEMNSNRNHWHFMWHPLDSMIKDLAMNKSSIFISDLVLQDLLSMKWLIKWSIEQFDLRENKIWERKICSMWTTTMQSSLLN